MHSLCVYEFMYDVLSNYLLVSMTTRSIVIGVVIVISIVIVLDLATIRMTTTTFSMIKITSVAILHVGMITNMLTKLLILTMCAFSCVCVSAGDLAFALALHVSRRKHHNEWPYPAFAPTRGDQPGKWLGARRAR